MKEKELFKLAEKNKAKNGSIDIVKIATELGIEVYAEDGREDCFNAEIAYNISNNLYEIIVNKNHSINRQRFSIAHEISHFIKHKEELKKSGSLQRENRSDALEKEADFLAEKILMPESLVLNELKNVLKNTKLSIFQINKLAKRFKVSIIVANIRLKNLGYRVPYISEAYSS